MRDQVRQQYDSWYTSGAEDFGRKEPLPILKKLVAILPQGSVLDVGGGTGTNAFYLAERGYAVTVCDFSQVALDLVEQQAKAKKLAVKTQRTDIVSDGLIGSYDVFLFAFVLHHVDSADALRIIKDAKVQTPVGGLHAIVTFANEGGLYERAKKSGRFYPDATMLRELYSDWQVWHCNEKPMLSCAKDKQGNPFENKGVIFLAQKV